jgi:hypothetical protein
MEESASGSGGRHLRAGRQEACRSRRGLSRALSSFCYALQDEVAMNPGLILLIDRPLAGNGLHGEPARQFLDTPLRGAGPVDQASPRKASGR